MAFRHFVAGISLASIVVAAAPRGIVASQPLRVAVAKALVLQPTEVPGFRVAESHIVTNAQLAQANRVSVSTFTREGRLTGYRIVYSRTTTSGIASVTNSIAIYSTAAAARQTYAAYAAGVLKSFTRAQSAHVGDESLLFSHSQLVRGTMAIEAAIAFRAGQYRAYLQVAGTEGPTVIPQLLTDARRVLAHMQRAGISER